MTDKPSASLSPSILFRHLKPETRDRILTGLTIVLLLHLFVVSPLELHNPLHLRPIGLVFMVVLGSGLVILARGVVPLAMLALFALLLGLGFYFEDTAHASTVSIGTRAASWLLIAMAIIWIVARAVYAPGPITYARIIGAVLLYVTIGIFFVALYLVMAVLIPDAFRGVSVKPHASLPTDFVYFSFTTLTTVGYGDIVPVDPLVRSLCNVEAIIGQIFPATVLARLVSDQVSSRGAPSPKEPS